MKALEFTAEIDKEHRLQLTMPVTTMPGPVRVLVLLPDTEHMDDGVEAAWEGGIAREWAADWNDAGEDIYSLHDGVPIDATR
jgi:hypothetical protein